MRTETTLKECFNNDSEGIGAENTFAVTTKNINGKTKFQVEITFKVSMPWISDKIIYFIYIPHCERPLDVCLYTISNYKECQKQNGIVDFKSGRAFDGELQLGVNEPNSRDTIYIYNENNLSNQIYNKEPIDKYAKDKNLTLIFRDEEYRKSRAKSLKTLAFISHDSRDKDLIARPLAQELSRKLFNVWFDEYSLQIGDNLRESIEKGIKESKKCILILTPNFLNNPGWTKKEFDSIFTKEIIEKQNVILPIWYKVSAEEIYEYSPSLANTMALHWPDKEKIGSNEYKNAVERIIKEIINHQNKHQV